MPLSKNRWLSRVIIFLFGVVLMLVALPTFCRFTVAALDASNLSNIFAGITGVAVSMLGLPLMVIAFHRRHPLDLIGRFEDCTAGQWICGTMILIIPSQFAWYLLHEWYLPRCGTGPISTCFPLLTVMLVSAAISLIALLSIVAHIFIPSLLREPSR
ncbi:MAG: hypothetical protein ACEQSB_04905 [Undibacterium sp.]